MHIFYDLEICFTFEKHNGVGFKSPISSIQ